MDVFIEEVRTYYYKKYNFLQTSTLRVGTTVCIKKNGTVKNIFYKYEIFSKSICILYHIKAE